MPPIGRTETTGTVSRFIWSNSKFACFFTSAPDAKGNFTSISMHIQAIENLRGGPLPTHVRFALVTGTGGTAITLLAETEPIEIAGGTIPGIFTAPLTTVVPIEPDMIYGFAVQMTTLDSDTGEEIPWEAGVNEPVINVNLVEGADYEPTWLATRTTGAADVENHPWGPFPANWSAYSSDTRVFPIYATYELPAEYTLYITATFGGTTDPAGTRSYFPGDIATVTALPDSGYTFRHWELDGVDVGAANPINITMDADHNLHVVFTAIHTLSVNSSPIPVTFEVT